MKEKRKEEVREYLAFIEHREKSRPLDKYDGVRLLNYAMELLAALDEAEKRLDLIDPEAIKALVESNKKQDEYLRKLLDR